MQITNAGDLLLWLRAAVGGQCASIERHMIEPVPVREAVISMFVHNDYTHDHAPAAELFSDRLELTSHEWVPKTCS